jgi:hypothetical protein
MKGVSRARSHHQPCQGDSRVSGLVQLTKAWSFRVFLRVAMGGIGLSTGMRSVRVGYRGGVHALNRAI